MIENIDLANPAVQIISVLLGIVVLVIGRRLFWLTVGAIGFIIGLGLALDFFANQTGLALLIIGLIAGGIGAMLAILLQKIAVSIIGFIMGGYSISWIVLEMLELNFDQWEWLLFIVGGIIGAILVAYLFELALIILSSLIGATMILQVTNFNPLITAGLFFVLFIIGLAAQSQSMGKERADRRSSHR